VAKYFAMEEEDFRAYRREHLFRDKLFDGYREEVIEVYKANGFRKLAVALVYDYLEEKYGALPANELSLRNYIGYLIRTDGLRLEEGARLYAKVPELPFGQQMQLDFGQYRCRSGLRLYIFAVLLAASRYKYVIFQGRPFRTRDVIGLLLEAFDYFGGRPEELVIDQDRLMVVSENAGDIVCTKDFQQLVDEQEVKLWVCRRADPESKGKIENLVKFVKGNSGLRDGGGSQRRGAAVAYAAGQRQDLPGDPADPGRGHRTGAGPSEAPQELDLPEGLAFRAGGADGQRKGGHLGQGLRLPASSPVQEQNRRDLHDRGGVVRFRHFHWPGDRRLQAVAAAGAVGLVPDLPAREREDDRRAQGRGLGDVRA